MKTTDLKKLREKARNIRRDIIKMITKAQSGHPGGSLSSTDLMTVLYFAVLRHDPQNPEWEERDRVVFSKGHTAPLWYAILCEFGYFDKKHLDTLRKYGTILQGHPDMNITPGVDMTSGSLGQGLSVAVGMSLSRQLQKKSYRVYVLLGDGEIQEGQIWEAAMAAGHYRVDSICAILDNNSLQIDGKIQDIMNPEPIAEKWRAFGWNVIDIDGHNVEEILDAYKRAEEYKGKPTIILARTVKGKGVSFMEGVVGFHGKAPTDEEGVKALAELEEMGNA
ncbi:MAG: transketolase [Candidatus Ancaeobacter aquaticus]|nr:transketolase [Candidatus Ancaeobacter aquaticus]